MVDRVKEIRERVRRVNSAVIEGTIDRVIAGIADAVERILFAFACRYAGGVASGDFEKAADAMEWAVQALRASDTGRSEAEAMRADCIAALGAALTEWRAHLEGGGEIAPQEAEGAVTALQAARARLRALQPGGRDHG